MSKVEFDLSPSPQPKGSDVKIQPLEVNLVRLDNPESDSDHETEPKPSLQKVEKDSHEPPAMNFLKTASVEIQAELIKETKNVEIEKCDFEHVTKPVLTHAESQTDPTKDVQVKPEAGVETKSQGTTVEKVELAHQVSQTEKEVVQFTHQESQTDEIKEQQDTDNNLDEQEGNYLKST
jgi:hypothetical protein